MKVETYKCDVCGKQKGETNHWWLMYRTAAWLAIDPWDDMKVSASTFQLCGAECVQKKVSEFLT